MKGRRSRPNPDHPDAAVSGLHPSSSPEVGNSFGLLEAIVGIAAGFIFAFLGVSIYAALTRHASRYGEDIVSLLGLWAGFVGAAAVATRSATRFPTAAALGDAGVVRGARFGRAGTGKLASDYGLVLRPWPDIPLGIAVGIAAQYLLVPVVEAPLAPFVHHLYSRLGHPAQSLTGNVFGAGLVVLAVLVCVGSPVVEELFFRGLLLRSLLGTFHELGPRLGPALSIVLTALVFALVHFEALQFLGLAGFGVVLGYLAWRTGRLGPSIVAHLAFNTVTIIAIVVTR